MRKILRGCVEVPIVLTLLVGLGIVALCQKAMRGTKGLVLLLALLPVSCKTSHSAEADAHLTLSSESKLSDVEHAQASGAEHEGPWTETTYTFALPEEVMPSAIPPTRDGVPVPGMRVQATQGVAGEPAHGPLTSITVRDYQGRDVTWQTTSEGLKGAETHSRGDADSKSTTSFSMKPAGGCLLGLGFWGAILIAGVLAAGIAYLHFRKALL